MDPLQEQCELFMVIYNPRDLRVLLKAPSPHGNLPSFVTAVRPRLFFFEKTAEFLPEVRDHFAFAFDITLLRCMWYKRYNEKELYGGDTFRAILVLEGHGDSFDMPGDMQWQNPSSIVFPRAALADGKDAVQSFLDECRTGSQPALRPLFARPMWYYNAVTWMSNQLLATNNGPISKVTQVSCSYRGTVLKADMVKGSTFYLKCGHFINEASVCVALVGLIPKFVAAPIAVDIERRLLLMSDYGEISSIFRYEEAEATQWAKVLAEIHQATIGKEQRLQDAGLLLLTFETMKAEIDHVFSSARRLKIVDEHTSELFEKHSGLIRRDCQLMIDLKIPITFVHGDLYFSNVYRNKEGEASHGIMDFGESTVSHPFIDILACRDRPTYSRSWMYFLQKNLPQLCSQLSTEKLLEAQGRCLRLDLLWTAVRLSFEIASIELPAPPQMLRELEGTLQGLVRTYDRLQEKIIASQLTS